MIDFLIFKKEHLPFFRSWLNQDHIKDYWQESEDNEVLTKKFFEEYPARGLHAFIIHHDSNPIGFIQYYEAAKVGNGWWPLEKPGTFGIDLIIGEPHLVNKGLGPKIIASFIEFLKSRESTLKEIIIDPDPKNQRAIRAFEKAGFKKENEMSTPGGPALLMRKSVSV